VLPHALNREHGRAPQLALWGLAMESRSAVGDAPVLLVISPSDVKLSELLDRYQDLCGLFGALPPPQVVNVDHGGKRFLLFAIPAGAAAGQPAGCVTPAIAHINVPEAGARLPANF